MPTKKNVQQKKSRKLFCYSEEKLKLALSSVREGKIGVREASREFGVPKSTLQDRLSGKCPDPLRKTGPCPIMTLTGEQRIADWAVKIAKCGFPIKKQDLIETVGKIAKENGKINLFRNGKPGEKWYRNFLKRHPEISLREAEDINKARAIVTVEYNKCWFQELKKFLKENNFEDVMDDASRVFNGDESGFSLCPKTGNVLAPKGFKNLYSIKIGNEKETSTVLVTFNAYGDLAPPLVVFPYVRPPKALVNNMPENWVLGRSESGWMKGDIFFEYISNDFNKWLDEKQVQRPIILFIDGHRSHMTLPLSNFCENKIILYALPPNTTHILQPADVSVFRPLNQQWKTTIKLWQNKQDANTSVTKINFCKVFQEALENTNMVPCIKNGFRKCGLFPLEENNVDYSKCVKNVQEQVNLSDDNVTGNYSNDQELNPADFQTTRRVLAKIEKILYDHEINVNLIYDEINILENQGKTPNPSKKIRIISDMTLNSELQFPKPLSIGSIISMDSIEILSFDDALEQLSLADKDLSLLNFTSVEGECKTTVNQEIEEAVTDREACKSSDANITLEEGQAETTPNNNLIVNDVEEMEEAIISGETFKSNDSDATELQEGPVEAETTPNKHCTVNEVEEMEEAITGAETLKSKDCDVKELEEGPIEAETTPNKNFRVNEVEEMEAAITGEEIFKNKDSDVKELEEGLVEAETTPNKNFTVNEVEGMEEAITGGETFKSEDSDVKELEEGPVEAETTPNKNFTVNEVEDMEEAKTDAKTAQTAPIKYSKNILDHIPETSVEDINHQMDKESSRKNTEKENNKSVPDNKVQHILEKTPIKDQGNLLMMSTPLQSPFSTHLKFPEAIRSSENSKKREKLPSAISSRAWRTYYEKKNQEKEQKLDAQKRKKEQQLNRSLVKSQNQRQSKSTNRMKKPIGIRKRKVKCSLCDDDLESDTEDDLLKNLGCDFCYKWFHLGCIEFCNMTYEEAAGKELKCAWCC